MTFMGVKPDLAQFESQIDIEYFSSMPLTEYRQKIQDGDYDIGTCELYNQGFGAECFCSNGERRENDGKDA
jgi:hypothetical protein